jgi:hypothetical protein
MAGTTSAAVTAVNGPRLASSCWDEDRWGADEIDREDTVRLVPQRLPVRWM